MDKIINYIKKGRGLGFIFLLAVAVLKTIPIMFEMKSVYADLQPKIMLIADDFLPIKIEKGKYYEENYCNCSLTYNMYGSSYSCCICTK